MGTVHVRTLAVAVASLALLAATSTASAAAKSTSTVAKPSFRPRIGHALGLVPAAGTSDIAVGSPYPEVYNGGPVMKDVTVHTVFWAPSGYAFGGSPGAGTPAYVPLVQQFFTDVAHDSGTTGALFSILGQYGDTEGQGSYDIHDSAAADSVTDTDPFPARSRQCASPNGIATCITDDEVTSELDKLIQADDPSGRGLGNVWEVFLPSNVDECLGPESCGTNAFAGYHSSADHGHGVFVYAVMIDTAIEVQPTPGADPEGNPDAEATIDTAGHETVEAMTDPLGDAWIDPNGYEVADKCENSVSEGTALGYALDGSPYDQLINGHEYEIQQMWSNAIDGCVEDSTTRSDGLPIASVSLHQFSPVISGSAGGPVGRVPVQVTLFRAQSIVATGRAVTRADGDWGPVVLRGPGRHGTPHGVGDDRDVLLVGYGRHGPKPELIETGSGGDPFTESGWTGWLDLDTGFDVGGRSVTIGPCGQTGVLTLTVDGRATATSPLSQCSTETSQSTVPTSRLTPATRVTMSSLENRASSSLDPAGALVDLSVTLGEPGSVAAIGNPNVLFPTTGMPACIANLRLQDVRCTGLVPGEQYTLRRSRGHAVRRARADYSGTITVTDLPGSLPVARGDVFRLTNPAHRLLTTLHVADLRVAIDGDERNIASGTCQPGEYWGAPLANIPSSSAVGVGGAAGTGFVCPDDGRAGGLPDGVIAQTDDRSGGETVTSLPMLEGTAPTNDAIVSGAFTAIAQTGVTGSNGGIYGTGAAVALTISSTGSHATVFHAANVATPSGVAVPALAPGVYKAVWVLSDRNGDTRTVHTTFVEQ